MTTLVEVPLWLLIVLGIILLLYMNMDLPYFLRMAYTVLKGKCSRKKTCVLHTTTIRSWCSTNDVDTLLYHMNNARYLRELDFARADFYERSGLYAAIKAAGGGVVQAATTVRYRRFIKPCSTFLITSKVVYWDDITLFMEHRFVGGDGFIHAVVTCRQRTVDASFSSVLQRLADDCPCRGTHDLPDKMPTEVSLWVQSNELSSAILRMECTCKHVPCICRVPAVNGVAPSLNGAPPTYCALARPNGIKIEDPKSSSVMTGYTN